MICRKATLMDSVDITKLWMKMNDEIPCLKMNGGSPENFLAVWTHNTATDGSHHTFVVEDEGKIVGFLYGYFTRKEYNPSEYQAFVESIYIDKEYRNMDAYNLLVSEAIELCKNLQVHEIRINSEYNDRATKFWSRNGYTPILIVWRKEV